MELHLSKNSACNVVLSNDAGKTLYTITTPFKFSRDTTTIYRHTRDADGTDERQELARIQWHSIRSSRLIFNGQIYETDTFLQRSKLGYARTFRAPDGQSYKWKLESSTSYLELDDGSSTPRTVARTQQRNFLTGKKPALHIDESILHILDLVIATWSYAEQRRREMQYGNRDY